MHTDTQLRTKMLFGSDFPLIKPERWIADFKAAAFKPEVHDLILKQNLSKGLSHALQRALNDSTVYAQVSHTSVTLIALKANFYCSHKAVVQRFATVRNC